MCGQLALSLMLTHELQDWWPAGEWSCLPDRRELDEVMLNVFCRSFSSSTNKNKNFVWALAGALLIFVKRKAL